MFQFALGTGMSATDPMQNRNEWMVMDSSEVVTNSDSTTCDRIGSSFSAFRHQTVSRSRAFYD